ncbi:hypothetical protein [Aurantimonas marina]|uniref:hypothetical protein n=1 Tax=Aurantimonas marina TaxID=2780508 RepID=UPI0019D02DF0|nr:hypothetical protein [Aurantimonas marina]
MHSSELRYCVEPTGGRWMVSFCHSPHGFFDRRVDAIRSALSDADRVERMGHKVTVVVARPADAPDLAQRVLRPPH